jgi:hypothetical protein
MQTTIVENGYAGATDEDFEAMMNELFGDDEDEGSDSTESGEDGGDESDKDFNEMMGELYGDGESEGT